MELNKFEKKVNTLLVNRNEMDALKRAISPFTGGITSIAFTLVSIQIPNRSVVSFDRVVFVNISGIK
jgi:hypothetical protein